MGPSIAVLLCLLGEISGSREAPVAGEPVQPVRDEARREAPAATDLAPAVPDDTARREAAAAAIDEARVAAARGDYEAAAQAFARALALRPSPALHYNLAVCHHRRMLSLPEGEPRNAARDAAIAAYNAYLSAAPEAEDREAVAATVFELGGRPATLDAWTVDRGPAPTTLPELRTDPALPAEGPVTPDPARGDARPFGDSSPAPEPSSSPGTPAATASPPPAHGRVRPFPRGRFGFGFATILAGFSKRRDATAVADVPEIAAMLRGSGFVDRKRRVAIGVELGFGGQPIVHSTHDRVVAWQLGLATEYGHPLAHGRVEIGAGALIGLRGEGLHFDRSPNARCPVNANGRSSTRGGLLAGARGQIAVLLGARKQHELALRLTPAIALYGEGTRGTPEDQGACVDAFTQFGLTGPDLVFAIELGYAPRF